MIFLSWPDLTLSFVNKRSGHEINGKEMYKTDCFFVTGDYFLWFSESSGQIIDNVFAFIEYVQW